MKSIKVGAYGGSNTNVRRNKRVGDSCKSRNEKVKKQIFIRQSLWPSGIGSHLGRNRL